MLTKKYWLKLAERAVKTAAQSAVLFIAADQFSAWNLNYAELAGYALGGALLSALTSLATTPFGEGDDPGLV